MDDRRDGVETARRAREWGRPVTDAEADKLLHTLDAARARVAELEATIRRLVAAGRTAEALLDQHNLDQTAAYVHRSIDAALTRKD